MFQWQGGEHGHDSDLSKGSIMNVDYKLLTEEEKKTYDKILALMEAVEEEDIWEMVKELIEK